MSASNQQPYAGLTAQGIVLVKTTSLMTLSAGPPQGLLGGQAGSPSQPPDVVWDYLHQTLWVCTSPGDSTTVTWTQVQFVTGGSFTNLTVVGGVTAGTLNVAGAASVGSTMTVVSGGLVVEAGGATITGTSVITGNLTVGATTHLAGDSYPNGTSIFWYDTLNAAHAVIGVDSSNRTNLIGGANGTRLQRQDGNTYISANGAGDLIIGIGQNANPIGNITNGAVWLNAGATLNIYNNNGGALSVGTGAGSPLLTGYFFGSTGVGSVTSNGSATAYNTASARALKDLHGPADVCDDFAKLRVYDASFKQRPANRYPMLVHDEVAAVCPWACEGEGVDGQINHSGLVPMLIAKIQELEGRLAVVEKGLP